MAYCEIPHIKKIAHVGVNGKKIRIKFGLGIFGELLNSKKGLKWKIVLSGIKNDLFNYTKQNK